MAKPHKLRVSGHETMPPPKSKPPNASPSSFKRNIWKVGDEWDRQVSHSQISQEESSSYSETLTEEDMLDPKVNSAAKISSLKVLQKHPLHEGKS